MNTCHFLLIAATLVFQSECTLTLSPKNGEVIYDGSDIRLRCTHTPSSALITSITWTYEKGKPESKSVATYLRFGNRRTQGADYRGRAYIETPVTGGSSSALLINDTRQGDIGVYTGDYTSIEGTDICQFTVINEVSSTVSPISETPPSYATTVHAVPVTRVPDLLTSQYPASGASVESILWLNCTEAPPADIRNWYDLLSFSIKNDSGTNYLPVATQYQPDTSSPPTIAHKGPNYVNRSIVQNGWGRIGIEEAVTADSGDYRCGVWPDADDKPKHMEIPGLRVAGPPAPKPSRGAIAGGVVGGIVAISIISLVVLMALHRKQILAV